MATERDLGRILIEELTVVAGALAGGVATEGPGEAPLDAQWTVTLAAEGAMRAMCTLTVDDSSASGFAQAVTGRSDHATIEGVLRDAVGQAVQAAAGRDELNGVQLTVRGVGHSDNPPNGTPQQAAAITVAGLPAPMRVGYYAILAPAMATHRARPGRANAAEAQQARLDVILDIDLPVVVRFGRTDMTIKALSRLGPGSVIDLGRAPDDPVELLVSDRVVARGDVVVVGGNYGIRIVDVVSPSERMRSLEA